MVEKNRKWFDRNRLYICQAFCLILKQHTFSMNGIRTAVWKIPPSFDIRLTNDILFRTFLGSIAVRSFSVGFKTMLNFSIRYRADTLKLPKNPLENTTQSISDIDFKRLFKAGGSWISFMPKRLSSCKSSVTSYLIHSFFCRRDWRARLSKWKVQCITHEQENSQTEKACQTLQTSCNYTELKSI